MATNGKMNRKYQQAIYGIKWQLIIVEQSRIIVHVTCYVIASNITAAKVYV